MNKTGIPLLHEKLLTRTGWWYPFLVLLFLQAVNTLLVILLTAILAQANAGISRNQAGSLLIFGGIALLVRNVLLLLNFRYLNKDLLWSLSKISQPDVENVDTDREIHAWEQVNVASKNYVIYEFIGLIALVIVPTLVFGYYSLHLNLIQVIHLGLPALAAGLVNLIIGDLILDRWFEPIVRFLLPKSFDVQLMGLKGTRLWAKLSLYIIGLVLISLLLTVPTSYQQVYLVFSDPSRSPERVNAAYKVILTAGLISVAVGVFLSIRLITYFSTSFRKIFALLRNVETGDLSHRIAITSPDDFGSLNIYLNHNIDRLQIMTSTLEQQVAERTAQLSQLNDQLNVELKERKFAQDKLAYSALHDSLTSIPNRLLFMDRLRHAMERARRHDHFPYAVLFMDLDHFKVVNDSLGHNVGDLLLIESARRITSCVRIEDTVARLGGDEFVILLEELESPTDCILVAERIKHEMSIPANLGGHKVFISVSMGIVLGDARYERPTDILRDADIAMYRVKRQGRGHYEIFDPVMLEGVMSRLEMETNLRKALERQEFLVHYQPILEIGTQRIVGFEALLRWQHPSRGLIQPGDFISIAEEIGVIVPIGYWVLDEACRQIRLWQDAYPMDPPLTMNVNLSTRQCSEVDLVEKIGEILEKNQVHPGCLKLELTESLIVEDSEATAAMLSKLREMGIEVQIDDFGTGYSSLGHLHHLPIDTLKIDRTFISQLGTNGGDSEIVRTILALAHGLGMKVIAEGVETDEQLSRLKAMECEYVQGYLIARPVSSQEAGALLGKPAADDIEEK